MSFRFLPARGPLFECGAGGGRIGRTYVDDPPGIRLAWLRSIAPWNYPPRDGGLEAGASAGGR